MKPAVILYVNLWACSYMSTYVVEVSMTYKKKSIKSNLYIWTWDKVRFQMDIQKSFMKKVFHDLYIIFFKKLKWSLFKMQRILASTRNAWLGDLRGNIQRKSVPYICGTPKQISMHQIQTSTKKPKTPSIEGPRNQ